VHEYRKTTESSPLTLYSTIFISFILGICAIWIAQKIWPTQGSWQRSLLALSAFVMVCVILWFLLQILIGVPSLAQTVDIPAIGLGLLIAYGFQNAVVAIRNRAKSKFK
jgi:hypothetical protein